MKNFWALPAFLRIALASQHAFSVFDDLLAFPQYEVVFPNTFITENDASSLLANSLSHRTSATPDSQETQELSKANRQTPPPSPHDEEYEEKYEAVVLGGQRYLCSIPIIPEEPEQNNTASAAESKAEEEKELMRANDRGWELLEGMRGSCIYYSSGWWSYSFCYKDYVKQFHQLPPTRGIPIYPPVEDATVKSYILGRYPSQGKKKDSKERQKTLGKEEGSKGQVDDEGNVAEDDKLYGSGSTLDLAKLETKGSSRYLVQRLSSGTECDLTGKDRKIEVQFHCNPQASDKISMIKETSTCAYLMIIYTPRLCHDVAFLPPQENLAHPISCRPVIPESDVDAWNVATIEEKIKETERLIALENENPLREMEEGAEGRTKRRPIIGGIEVGAQILVGSEGKVIEKSVVAGGGKEEYVGTVASSSGHMMSKEEMKKYNIHDPKDVEKIKKNLEKLAGRNGWKLDLVDTPRGREFRPIIEIEEEEDPKKEAKTGKGSKKKADKEDKGKEAQYESDDDEQEGSEEVYKDEL